MRFKESLAIRVRFPQGLMMPRCGNVIPKTQHPVPDSVSNQAIRDNFFEWVEC
jgi:hypothetical protein